MHQIESIIAEWRTPRGKTFRVECENGNLFELFFDQRLKKWTITEIWIESKKENDKK